jgi:hypothetical protein
MEERFKSIWDYNQADIVIFNYYSIMPDLQYPWKKRKDWKFFNQIISNNWKPGVFVFVSLFSFVCLLVPQSISKSFSCIP